MCRGSLAWLGRQTHNLPTDEISGDKGAKRPLPEVAGSNPAPGTTVHSLLNVSVPETSVSKALPPPFIYVELLREALVRLFVWKMLN